MKDGNPSKDRGEKDTSKNNSTSIRNGLVSRRSAIKATGVALSAISVPGIASAKSNRKKDQNDIDEASGGAELTLSGENAMSPRELKEYAKDMAQEYEDVSPSDVAPHLSDGLSTMSQTPNLQNVGTVGAWNNDYAIKTPYGLTYATVENAATLYRSDESDDAGRWYYFVWLWSKAEPASQPWGGYWPYTWFRSDFSATDGAYVDKFSPASRVDKHSEPISIGVTVGLGQTGPVVGVTGSTTISEGYITPDNITQGQNGTVGFKFRASGSFCRTVNALNGAIHLTSEEKYEQYTSIPAGAFNWSVSGHTNGL